MRVIFFLFCVFGVTQSYAAELSVFFSNQKITIHKPDGTLLRDFIVSGPKDPNIDWDMSLISNNSSNQLIEDKKNNLLQKLQQLKNKWILEEKFDFSNSAAELMREISSVNVAGRLVAHLDPDFLMVHPENNDKLNGSYNLYLVKKDYKLHMLGLINSPYILNMKSGASIDEYVEDYSHLAGADKNTGFLIEGNGSISKVPLAYWNRHHIEPAPGATLFIGFDKNILPSDYKSINDDIATLIANKVQE
ncbi:MAG: capsule biosynthesis GfcC family protein [Tolumonas sp.]|nr:capsule biosynthesis GfcC family protein [Tolumonas sp.]